jgi:multiple sugar transport system permease protein
VTDVTSEAPTANAAARIRLGSGAGMSNKARAAARRRKFLEWIAVHSLAIVVSLFFAGPIVFIFLASVMSSQQSLTSALWPSHFEWHNYVDVFRVAGFLTWWRNSLIYSCAVTALTVLSSVPTAYAMAKFRFPGRRLSLMLVVSAMMLPPQVIVVPMYIVWAKQFHLAGTLWPLIIPSAFGDAFSIFLLRQFLLTVPKEYLDAAKVDGCGELRTLVRVVVPMIRPAISAVALFQFFYCWNDFFGPQIYASSNPNAWTLSYGLSTFQGAHQVNWNLMMAANIVVMAPTVVLFFFAQRAFMEGVTLTGVKG